MKRSLRTGRKTLQKQLIDKKTCPYFEELSDIFGMTSSVQPVAVCSNRAGAVVGDLIDASSSSSLDSVTSIEGQGSSSGKRATPH